MQVVCVQLDTAWEDAATNCERVEELLSEVRIHPGALIVLPEMFTAGFTMNVDRAEEGVDRRGEQLLRWIEGRFERAWWAA